MMMVMMVMMVMIIMTMMGMYISIMWDDIFKAGNTTGVNV